MTESEYVESPRTGKRGIRRNGVVTITEWPTRVPGDPTRWVLATRDLERSVACPVHRRPTDDDGRCSACAADILDGIVAASEVAADREATS